MDPGLSPIRVCGSLVASTQLSNFVPDIERNLIFRGYSSMTELDSSTIWCVHTNLVDMYRLIVALFQIQPITLTRSTLDGSILSTPLLPHIQPQYYAAIIAAEAIGNSGNTRVVELNITDTRVSGYAFYQGNQLKKAIFINSLAFFTTTTTPRPSTHVDLSFISGTVSSKMEVKRLFVPYVQFFEPSIVDHFIDSRPKQGMRMILRA